MSVLNFNRGQFVWFVCEMMYYVLSGVFNCALSVTHCFNFHAFLL